MKFDVIISNPPYNKDMYLDFVEAAYDLLNPDGVGVFITPAKFYAKGGQKNEEFRKRIMPHIKEVHVYPDCKDIFDIAEAPGIAYYSIYKNQSSTDKQIQIHSRNTAVASELEIHSEQPIEFINQKIQALLTKVMNIAGNKPLYNEDLSHGYQYYCSNTFSGHAKSSENDLVFFSGRGGLLSQEGFVTLTELKTQKDIDKYKVVVGEQIHTGFFYVGKNALDYRANCTTYPSILKPGEIPKGSFVILKWCDTYEEAESYVSYITNTLISFGPAISLISMKTFSKENWRHVPALPAPYKFDHIYTNEEIFDIFQLTPDERKLITSIIKERAKK